jgi:hypothetical protein
MGATTFADVSAGIRDTIAAYAQALDDGRTDDIVATFCPDGVVDIPDLGTHEGHAAIRAAFSRFQSKVAHRHVVVNTHVTDWSDDEATAVSDLIFLVQRDASWVVQMVGRYHDRFHHHGGSWRFHHRTVELVTDPAS